ncbi:hypothetical protein PMY12_14665 [Clostridium tertium]|uniref:hypothetical protein n=1 Tax=Clostridium tertium TaxID=1559 RepID=UPI00232DD234|nr:hypothetical protein [Clostridium tertium]MDB1931708.1 hypothetical protein [Clostridium tertium]MDB1938246.1 hypothetical protein [Clostridium tertium]MDI9215990.1 hypothetical protein [Clostridium tertium]
MAVKIPLSFKDTEKEKELYNWVKEKSEIIGQSNFIKQILYERMLLDKSTKK